MNISYGLLKSAKNLVQNPYFNQELEHWTKQCIVSELLTRDWSSHLLYQLNAQNSWVNLEQRIILPSSRKRFLIAKAEISRTCAQSYIQLCIEFDSKAHLAIEEIRENDMENWANIFGRKNIVLKCKVPDEVRSLTLKLRSIRLIKSKAKMFEMASLRIFSLDDEGHTMHSIRKFSRERNQLSNNQRSKNKVRTI
jgi:hypothetical protein